ncbi:MAG: hypothetical protein ACU0AX_07695 [Roseovarius sp.]|uniref:hypothetical protein n=1 Tax=Roseovarius sp. TaxID=1486281 RepID=UPI0040593EB8
MTRLLPVLKSFFTGPEEGAAFADLTPHAVHTRHAIGTGPGARAALANLRAASRR